MKEKAYQFNSYYQGMLQNLYGGSKGCFVAFMQFFYQYNQSLIFSQNLSDCFEKLYKLELNNCVILSEIILLLGGDNKFYSNACKFLTGYNVDYTKNFQKIFLADIEFLEINIIDVKNIFYKIDDKNIKNKIKIILDNKKKALKLLKENYFKNNIIS